MNIKEFKPCAALAPYVSRWVAYETIQTPIETKIAPSGKSFINHNHGASFKIYKDDGSERTFSKDTYVFGHPLKNQGVAKAPLKGKNLVCEFTYTGLHRLLHTNVEDLVDREIPIKEIGLQELSESLFQSKEAEVKRENFEDFLLSKIPYAIEADCEVDDLIKKIEQQFFSNFESIGITNPSEKKRIYRKFKKHTGLSPKQFHRIYQLNTVIRLINEENFETLSELGLKSGYYDQADFIRHLKHFLKKSPSWLINHENEMLFLYMGGTNTF